MILIGPYSPLLFRRSRAQLLVNFVASLSNLRREYLRALQANGLLNWIEYCFGDQNEEGRGGVLV